MGTVQGLFRPPGTMAPLLLPPVLPLELELEVPLELDEPLELPPVVVLPPSPVGGVPLLQATVVAAARNTTTGVRSFRAGFMSSLRARRTPAASSSLTRSRAVNGAGSNPSFAADGLSRC